MQVLKGIETVDGFPAIFLEELKAVAVADLHLGYELALAEKGIFVPQTQLKEIKSKLRKILKKVEARKLVIVGDLKHEFGEASRQEWREVIDLIDFLRKKVEQIILIRGNHDNYLLNIISRLQIELYDPYYLEKGICFVHGHKKVKLPKEARIVITAHEHPSLALREGFDRIKVPCLLFGKMRDGRNFICLPAFSTWASGSDVNLIPQEELLSPFLREEVELEDLIPIALSEETGPLKFPKIGKLRLEA